jgi:hypothetical protein
MAQVQRSVAHLRYHCCDNKRSPLPPAALVASVMQRLERHAQINLSLRAKRSNPGGLARREAAVLDCFHLRAPRFGGLKPSEARGASVGGSSLRFSQR